MKNERPIEQITEPVTSDGLAGYDDHKQFWVYWREDGRESFTGTIMADLRGETCVLCNQPWRVCAESLRDQYHDRSASAYVHKTCFNRHLGYLERRKWWGLVDKLTATDKCEARIEALPNQYGGGWDTPWFRFHFRHRKVEGEEQKPKIVQTLIVGRRRRVNAIRFEKLTIAQVESLTTSFDDVTNTKGTHHERRDEYEIHAYTDDEDERYVKTFLQLLGVVHVPREPKPVETK